MGKTIGELAGFAMLILIWVLFLNLLQELKLIKKEKALLMSKVSLCLWITGLGYLLLGGFFYNISIDSASVFQYDVIWGYGSYGQIMSQLENGKVQGIFQMLYLMLARGTGKIFFKQYLSAAIYTSFLFAIAFGTQLYFLLRKAFGSQAAEKLLLLIFVFPFSYKLFLPSPASMICALAVMTAGGIVYNNRHLRQLKVNFRVSDWLYCFLLCAFISLNIMLYYKEMLLRG